jgi:imidazolonepropionase-like amidohydrolase
MESHEPPIVARPHPSDSLLFSGSDHRFAQSPQGDNARDLNHLVDLLGFSPGEALPCGRRVRGQLMNLGNEPGQLKEGYLADLLFVDGDPLEDLDLVVREKIFLFISKEGALSMECSALSGRQQPVAAD